MPDIDERDAARIREAVSALLTVERAVFLLHRVEELDYAAIGERLAIDVIEVERRLAAAIIEINRRLADGGVGEGRIGTGPKHCVSRLHRWKRRLGFR